MKFLGFLLKNNKWLMALAGLTGLLSGLANAKLIAIISDAMAASPEPAAGNLFFAMTLFALLTGILSQVFLVILAEKLSFNLRTGLCRQFMDKSIRALEELGQARMLAVFTRDIPSITRAFLGVPALLINASITMGCLVYLGFLSVKLLLALALFLVFAVISFLIPESFAVRFLKKNREDWDAMLTGFRALNEGAKELKLHNQRRDAFFEQVILRDATALRKSGFAHKIIYGLTDNWTQLLYFIFVGILLFMVPDSFRFDSKTLTGFILVALYIYGPISILINTIPTFREATVAMDMITKADLKISGASSSPKHPKKPKYPLPEPFCGLRFDQVTHRFYREKEQSHFTLGPIDLEIAAGELIFITGGNGSGKTTLAKLLAGLYQPESGHILLNGMLVTPGGLDCYRGNFSAIFNDFYVFGELLGMERLALDERAKKYLEKLQLDHKVSINNGRLSTTNLSTGQRKRLALLTCYLEDRPIYLFDEWAADQDPEFKDVFYRELLPELKHQGKTLLIISHDDRYFDCADRIIKLVDGRLCEQVLAGTLPEIGSWHATSKPSKDG